MRWEPLAGTRPSSRAAATGHLKLLWHGEWQEVPGYELPHDGLLVDVAATVPLVRLDNASGRLTRRPVRKVAVFLLTDGPASTLRKARTKREEPYYTGDYHVSLLLGSALPDGPAVVALVPRAPQCAQQLVVHRSLVVPVDDAFTVHDLAVAAGSLRRHCAALLRLGRQSYLYSAMTPPAELTGLLQRALAPRGDSEAEPASAFARAAEVRQPPERAPKAADTVLRLRPGADNAGMGVAVLGAGDYTRTEVIPALRRARLQPYVVSNREPQIAARVGREFGFVLATTDSERAIAELPAPGLVVVATAHDSHAALACAALDEGHRVFIEKPPAVTADDVQQLAASMRAHPGRAEVGFNRRYHPLVRRARATLLRESGPTTIACTVKELSFEADHWYFWPNQGTRITGNLCHWIDLAVFLLPGSPRPAEIALSPRIPNSAVGNDEERCLTVAFEDDSVLTILATTRGDDIRGVQEQIEVRRGGTTIFIDDLWKLKVRSGGIESHSRTLFRHKAHSSMYRQALGRIVSGRPSLYPVRDMVVVSAIQIAASELARTDGSIAKLPDWIAMAEEG